MHRRYSAASPIRPAPADPQPDWARVAFAVWRRVLASQETARKVGGSLYSQVEVCGAPGGFEGIIPAYVRVAQLTTVDPALLIAMMLHETGNMSSWWAAKPRRNPAGVFVTGVKRSSRPPAKEADLWQEWRHNEKGEPIEWSRGGRFSNWISSPGHPWRPNSVEAHAWRVAGYALPRFSPTQEWHYARACEGRPLPWFTRDSAGCWRELGKAHNRMRLFGAGWASPGKDYGEKIAAIANAITAEAF